ncbi:MAG: HAD-IC family P-type ATPase [Bacteroidetes bacterium]|nr:HAD-IC family P-type ATPase [Bacteroidota bacterium]
MPVLKEHEHLLDFSWHSVSSDNVFKKFVTSDAGLSEAEAKRRIEKYGENTLPTKEPPTLLKILLHQVLNPLIFILLIAAVASVLIGEATDAIFILIVIVLNSALGGYQEFNAERSAASLQNMLKVKTRVKRDNSEQEIFADKLVPGDIVMLESGSKVPADLRLISVSNLNIDESFLTGESLASEKKTGILAADIAVGDRSNMAFAGATVISGRGVGVVVGTGLQTEVGKIAENVTESDATKPPLVIRMESFTKQISYAVLFASFILASILWLRGEEISAVFFFVVALAVSAIPEGLPVALTVALSIATSRMSKRNVIVRKLTAVESLGSCTIIASDKTGTLTVNQQTAKLIKLPDGQQFAVSGEGYNGIGKVSNMDESKIPEIEFSQIKKLAKLGMLANESKLQKMDNESWEHHGDAVDVAFLALGAKLGYDPRIVKYDFKVLGNIPYESEKKYSAAFYDKDTKVQIALKGAVEKVIDLCDSMYVKGESIPIDKKQIENEALSMAENGYRVLAVAGTEVKGFENKEVYDEKDIPPLTLFGLVGFIDPLRPEAKDAIEKCKEAGIKVIMITGDHPATAATISFELGITDDKTKVVSGAQLSEIGSYETPEYEKLVMSAIVFARVSPAQKFEIVDVLNRSGEFVAVTGDGVNDAPALKRANIGVAMGSGTDVAKEISSMIVVDDNFSSIVSGVEEGRFAYDNVRKVIYLLISTGAAEVVLFIASILAGLPLPLLAVQLLWLNLVTNGIQDVALAFEGGEPGAMKRKPRKPNERIFNGQMIQQTLTSGLTMGLIAFGFWFYLKNYLGMDETHARNIILLLMVIMQNLHVFSCRSEITSAFRVPLKRNIVLLFGVLLAQGIHIASMHIPFMQSVLRVEPITLFEWMEVFVLAIPLLIIMEIFKVVKLKCFSVRHSS